MSFLDTIPEAKSSLESKEKSIAQKKKKKKKNKQPTTAAI